MTPRNRVRHPRFGEGAIISSQLLGWPDAGSKDRMQWFIHEVKFDNFDKPIVVDEDEVENLSEEP